MWDVIKEWAAPVVSIISSLIGGGPLGLVGFGLGIVVLVVGGIWAFNKFKNWKFNNAHDEQNEQSVKDHNKVIDKNKQHSDDDKETFDQSKTDKENAFNEDE